MGRMIWQERVVISPDLHHGEPCIKGTRIPVATIVGSLADGMTSGIYSRCLSTTWLMRISARRWRMRQS